MLPKFEAPSPSQEANGRCKKFQKGLKNRPFTYVKKQVCFLSKSLPCSYLSATFVILFFSLSSFVQCCRCSHCALSVSLSIVLCLWCALHVLVLVCVISFFLFLVCTMVSCVFLLVQGFHLVFCSSCCMFFNVILIFSQDNIIIFILCFVKAAFFFHLVFCLLEWSFHKITSIFFILCFIQAFLEQHFFILCFDKWNQVLFFLPLCDLQTLLLLCFLNNIVN